MIYLLNISKNISCSRTDKQLFSLTTHLDDENGQAKNNIFFLAIKNLFIINLFYLNIVKYTLSIFSLWTLSARNMPSREFWGN